MLCCLRKSEEYHFEFTPEHKGLSNLSTQQRCLGALLNPIRVSSRSSFMILDAQMSSWKKFGPRINSLMKILVSLVSQFMDLSFYSNGKRTCIRTITDLPFLLVRVMVSSMPSRPSTTRVRRKQSLAPSLTLLALILDQLYLILKNHQFLFYLIIY